MRFARSRRTRFKTGALNCRHLGFRFDLADERAAAPKNKTANRMWLPEAQLRDTLGAIEVSGSARVAARLSHFQAAPARSFRSAFHLGREIAPDGVDAPKPLAPRRATSAKRHALDKALRVQVVKKRTSQPESVKGSRTIAEFSIIRR